MATDEWGGVRHKAEVPPTDSFGGVRLWHGDCRDVLPGISSASVDAVISDPPYPEIDRDYGRLTEAQWFDLMNSVVEQCRRILKPSGSAVFVLQPNSEKAGRMRTWLWEFMARWGREWNMPQDVWWWNYAALPTEMANHQGGLRASLKACVWLGSPDCFRDQSAVLLEPREWSKKSGNLHRHDITPRRGTSKTTNHGTMLATCLSRGGSTPFNVIICSGSGTKNPNHGHGAQTPLELCRWWVRYICPPGGIVLDPFIGSGTVGLAACIGGRDVIGIESDPTHYATALKRLQAADGAGGLFDSLRIGDGT
jgi:DNA modification methylase